MSESDKTPFDLAWKQEEFRQVKESFDAWKRERTLWMVARGATLAVSVILLPAICAVCTWITFHSDRFSGGAVTAATTALLVEVLGLLVAVYRTLVGRPPQPLQPVLGKYSTYREEQVESIREPATQQNQYSGDPSSEAAGEGKQADRVQ